MITICGLCYAHKLLGIDEISVKGSTTRNHRLQNISYSCACRLCIWPEWFFSYPPSTNCTDPLAQTIITSLLLFITILSFVIWCYKQCIWPNTIKPRAHWASIKVFFFHCVFSVSSLLSFMMWPLNLNTVDPSYNGISLYDTSDFA